MPRTDVNPFKYTGPKVPAASVRKADYAFMLTHLPRTTAVVQIVKDWWIRQDEFNHWANEILYAPPDVQNTLAAQSTNPEVAAAVEAYCVQFAPMHKRHGA